MYGLIVRWSLDGKPPEVAEQLRAYVRDVGVPTFSGKEGLHQKVWSLRTDADGPFFSGTYLWGSPEARQGFIDAIKAGPGSKVSEIVGSGPTAFETFAAVGVVEGTATQSKLLTING